MSNRISSSHRIAFAAILAFVAIGSRAGAQGVPADPRWLPWTACWQATTPDGGREIGGGRVCVVPAGGASVDVVTIVAGKEMNRSTVNGDGIAHPFSKDGCSGTQMARFATHGLRVYLTSELTCPGNLVRKTSGIMSLTQTGEWLDVQGMSGKEGPSGVFVTRYSATSDMRGVPDAIASAIPARNTATEVSRTTAMAPLSLADIADASVANEPGTVQAWLIERTKGYTMNINADRLAKLSDQGVPPQVLDVLVALAYPKQFVLNTAGEPQVRPSEPGSRTRTYYSPSPYGWGYGSNYYSCSYGLYGTYSYYGYGLIAPGCYSPYFGYRGYGYGYYPYGYGYGYGYGYYPNGGTVVVVSGTGSSTPAAHGRVVKGSGYESGDRGQGGGRTSTPSTSSSGSTGSTGSAGTAGSASSSSSSSGGDRTAHKKP